MVVVFVSLRLLISVSKLKFLREQMWEFLYLILDMLVKNYNFHTVSIFWKKWDSWAMEATVNILFNNDVFMRYN